MSEESRPWAVRRRLERENFKIYFQQQTAVKLGLAGGADGATLSEWKI